MPYAPFVTRRLHPAANVKKRVQLRMTVTLRCREAGAAEDVGNKDYRHSQVVGKSFRWRMPTDGMPFQSPNTSEPNFHQ